MDYSQLPNDPDHPAGTSPWQTSPHQPAQQTSFGALPSESEPPSPIATQSPYPDSRPNPKQDDASDQDTLTGASTVTRRNGESISQAPTENGSSPDLSTRLQSPSLAEQAYSGQHRQHPPLPQQQQPSYQPQQQRSAPPSRYQTSNRPAQRQNVPQYKLQAKITGLERTGRKDPILRFDVYVGLSEIHAPSIVLIT